MKKQIIISALFTIYTIVPADRQAATNALVDASDLDAAKKALREGADINGISINDHNALHLYGSTALDRAISRNDDELIDFLLNQPNINVEIISRGGKHPTMHLHERTPLIRAARESNPEVTQKLLQKKANPNTATPLQGETALMAAAATMKDSSSIIRMLIEAGAHVNTYNGPNEPTIVYAVRGPVTSAASWFPHLNNLKTLLDLGGDKNSRDYKGNSLAMIAVAEGNIPALELLLDLGIRTDVFNKTGASFFNMPIVAQRIGENEKQIREIVKNYQKKMAWHKAAMLGEITPEFPRGVSEIVADYEVGPLTPGQKTELQRQIQEDVPKEKAAAEQKIREQEQKAREQEELERKKKAPAQEKIKEAIKKNDMRGTRSSLKEGADINALMYDGSYFVTPLALAILSGSLDVEELLLMEPTARVDIVQHPPIFVPLTDARVTELMMAALLSDRHSVNTLLHNKANPNAENPSGETALMAAATSSNDNSKLMKDLITAGANPLAHNKNGEPVIVYAVQKPLGSQDERWPHIVNVIELLRHGADKNSRNRDGDSLAMIAAREGNIPALEYLLKEGISPDIVNKYGESLFNLKNIGTRLQTNAQKNQAYIQRMLKGYEEKTSAEGKLKGQRKELTPEEIRRIREKGKATLK